MNKEFVEYNEALALKELGFNEPCFGYYEYSKNFLITDSVFYTNSELKNNGITTPLYQQAFDWFREKYDLDYSLLPESSSGHRLSTRTFNIVIYKYYMNMNVQAEIVRIDGKIARYNKREEAELECLKKLIEIVKEK